MDSNGTETAGVTNTPNRPKSVARIYSGMDTGGVTDTGITSISRNATLISPDMTDYLNTYRTWASFNLCDDVDAIDKSDFFVQSGTDANGNPAFDVRPNKDRKRVESTGVHAIFNKWHGVGLDNKAYDVRVSQNMPLLDSPQTRRKQRSMNACTVRDLVQKSQHGLLGAAMYEYSDFMYCKYLGRVPNNHLVTLRRYAIPVNDYIKPYGNPSLVDGDPSGITSKAENGGVPLGTMVTWFGTPGNELKNIMHYSVLMPFEEKKSEMRDIQTPSNSVNKNTGGALGSMFQKAFSNSAAQRAGNVISPGIFNVRLDKQGNQVNSPGPHYDANKQYSEVDVIKTSYRRGAGGLKMEHEFSLVFDYELKSYDGINGKQAMIDLLGNILTVCYTTGDFWPGAIRKSGGGLGYTPMSSLECMKHHDTISGYYGAFKKDVSTIRSQIGALFGGSLEGLKTLIDQVGGALLGGNLEQPTPAAQAGLNSLLADAVTGFWHVTVGNPSAPIASIGNLIMTKCEIEHYGPLGIDDFPTGLRVSVSLKCGKPRDKRLIERMYGGGSDRIYSPLDQSITEALNKAHMANNANDLDPSIKTFKLQGNTAIITNSHTRTKLDREEDGKPETVAQMTERREASQSAIDEAFKGSNPTDVGGKDTRVVLMGTLNGKNITERYFGTSNPTAIKWSAGETAEGVQSPPSSNDQTQNA